MFTFVTNGVRYCRQSSWGGCCRRNWGGGGRSGLLRCRALPAPTGWSTRISGSLPKRLQLSALFFLSRKTTLRSSRCLGYWEVTPVFLYAVGEVGDAGEGGGEGEGVGGEGPLAAAGEGGDDCFVAGPEVGAGHPGGLAAWIIFIGGHNYGNVASWIVRGVLILLEWARKVRAKMIMTTNMSWLMI